MENEKAPKQDLFGKNNKNFLKPNLNWLFAIIFIVLIALNFIGEDVSTKTISYTQFEQYVGSKTIEKISIITNKNLARAEILKDSLKVVFKKDELKNPNKGVIEV